MSTHLLVSADATVRARWLGAFPDSPVLATLPATPAGAPPGVTWLHLPADPDQARRAVTAAGAALPGTRLVALADMPADEQALDLMERGAAGYCHSHAGRQMLLQVAAVVSNQGLWVGPGLLARMIRAALPAVRATAPAPAIQTLSAREQQVAEAVAAGQSNKEIARALAITERTVKAHLSAIFGKLGVRDRLHLALTMRGAGR